VVAPMWHPGGFESKPSFRVQDGESSRQLRWMRAHVGCALVVRWAPWTRDSSTRASQVTSDDGEVDACGGNLGRVPIVLMPGAGQFFMCRRLVDQGRRVLRILHRACAASRVKDSSSANLIAWDSGDFRHRGQIVGAETGLPLGNSGVGLVSRPC
jgi:hypothetical protein